MCSTKKKTSRAPEMQSEAEQIARDDELEEVYAIFGEDFSQLSTLYQADSPRRIAFLRQAVAAHDHAQVARVAHAFSGSCASIGATRLCSLCKELEHVAQEERSSGLEEKLATIEAEYRRISNKLDTLRPRN
jgi:HPt (histidine-containing phosphotransfer) domain-containing protein